MPTSAASSAPTPPRGADAAVVLADGTVFWGKGLGAAMPAGVVAEVCFNTSITGYQEILTDPSYAGQIITFTFPHIGNVGTNDEDIETARVAARGLILREDITEASNWRSTQHLQPWLEKNNLTGISGIDTRKITKLIRAKGAKTVAIIFADNIDEKLIKETVEKINKVKDLNGVELANEASENREYHWENQGIWQQEKNSYHTVTSKKFKVAAIDYGAKLNILRCLTEVGCDVEVFGSKASFEEIMKYKPDGIFLSNGPGDPAQTGKYAIPVIQKFLENKIPLFGICLGHQLLALAIGAKTSKMHQGHRGANHPVQNLKTTKVEITSQNHGFCVEKDSLPKNAKVTHISLFDNTVEGLELNDCPAFSVQYHPESSPGPSDSFYLFEEFINLMKKNGRN